MVNLEFDIDPFLILMSLYPVCYNTVLARGNGWGHAWKSWTRANFCDGEISIIIITV